MEKSFKNASQSSEVAWCGSGRKRQGSLMGEILQRKVKQVKKTVEGERMRRDWRATKERKHDLMDAREGEKEGYKPEEDTGSCCLHILSHTLNQAGEGEEKEEDEEEQKSDLMVNEELGQETGTSSFHFLSLGKEEEKGYKEEEQSYKEIYYKEEKCSSMPVLTTKATAGLNRFHILSSALTEALKFELYLVQNL